MVSPVVRKPRFTRYFSLGTDHKAMIATKRGFLTVTSNTLLKVHAPDPREVIVDLLGDQWDSEYEELPDMEYFPGGIIDVANGKKVSE